MFLEQVWVLTLVYLLVFLSQATSSSLSTLSFLPCSQVPPPGLAPSSLSLYCYVSISVSLCLYVSLYLSLFVFMSLFLSLLYFVSVLLCLCLSFFLSLHCCHWCLYLFLCVSFLVSVPLYLCLCGAFFGKHISVLVFVSLSLSPTSISQDRLSRNHLPSAILYRALALGLASSKPPVVTISA